MSFLEVNYPQETAEQVSKVFNYLVMENPFVPEADESYEDMKRELYSIIISLHNQGGIHEEQRDSFLKTLEKGKGIIEENLLQANEIRRLDYEDLLNRLQFVITKLK